MLFRRSKSNLDSQVDDHGDQCSQLRDETNVSDEYLGGNSKESNRDSSQIEPTGNSKRSKGQNKETREKSKIRSTKLMKRNREVSSDHKKGQNKETSEVSKIRSTKPKTRTKEVSSDKMLERLCAWFVLFIAGIGLYFYLYISKTDTINHPLKIPKVNSKLTTSAKTNSKYFWGSYRANLYFGLKTRSPRSPVVGLMWMKQFPDSRKQGSNKLRHWCKEDDELVKYGWLRHDGSSFGIHEVEEEEFIFNTTFVKRQVGHHGWEWSARITAFSTNQNNAPVVSFFTYAALDKQGNLSYFKNNGKSAIVGSSEELGDFHISFKTSTDSRIIVHDSFEGHVSGLDVLDKTLSEHFVPKPLVENKEYMSLNGTKETDRGINFVVHQITAQLPLKFDIILKSNSVRSENILQGEILTREIEKRSGEFDKKFSSVFNLESKKYTLKAINFAKAALSNMLGSISYFHGSSRVQSEKSEEVLKHRQATLYTSIPSRSKFPRGFLWNVGFDLHLITLWDAKISKDIIAHWLNLINEEGWIPREQILGEEAEAKVPSEFIVQRNNIANPPSLFLAIQHLIKNKQNVKVFLEIFFPKMEKWFEWLQVSQAGKIHTSFYWRGRKGFAEMEFIPYTYASGLDDYPRASHPDENERHLDLRCWMAMASGVLANIAKRIGEDSSAYEKIYEDLTDNELLDRLHWDSKQKIFSDYGLHANDIDIYSDDGVLIDNIDMFSPTSKFYYVHAHPTFRYTGIFGYVSLYPLMLKILDSDSPRLEKMLSDLRKEDLLWTKYGIRSLSIKSEFYNKPNTFTDPPHWRGAIWINMNYLIISGLHHYSQVPGPYQNQASNIYTELRKNVVQNIFKQYNKRGYVFEQYDDITGIGKGSYPFTGWSALVVNIMAEKY